MKILWRWIVILVPGMVNRCGKGEWDDMIHNALGCMEGYILTNG